MKKSEMFFAMLRKSKNVLKDYANCDNHRKFLINLKYRYAMLQPSLRNVLRMIANDINRFDLEDSEFLSDILKNMHREIPKKIFEPKLIDKENGKVFTISTGKILLDDVMVFEESEEYHAFVVAYHCLIIAKKREAEFIKERDVELKRLNSLSDYN